MLIALVVALFISAPDSLFSVPDASRIPGGDYVSLPVQWKYAAADSALFAFRDFDDSNWESVDVRYFRARPIEGWNGMGWFRLNVQADSSAVENPPGIILSHRGAIDVFLNGTHLFSSGRPHAHPDSARSELQAAPAPLPLIHGENVIAVRYSNHRPELFLGSGSIAGFFPVVVSTYAEARETLYNQRRLSAWQYFFTGLLGALALLHLSLYAFHRRDADNLFLFAVALVLSLLTWILLWRPQAPELLIYRIYALNTTAMITCITVLAVTYRILRGRIPRFLPFLAIGFLTAVALVLFGVIPNAALLVIMLITALELVRTAVVALVRRRTAARLMAVGVFLLAVSISYAMAAELGLLPTANDLTVIVPLLGMMALAVASSISHAVQNAKTNTDLSLKLEEVQRLSDERLEQERRLREEERRGEDMRIALETKAAELEEARQLQLSLLPSKIPDHSDLEIAAFMETATEVGGDYYDFHLRDDVLTIAIGDATGHGLKAGSMVTATKALFSSVMSNGNCLVATLRESTGALKRMNMSRLYMALTLARWNGTTLTIASAGMPPVVVHRRASDSIETIRITGMPLGGFADFPYREEAIGLEPGDTVLFMSDGFPERFDPSGTMLGYDEAIDFFRQVAHRSPDEIIAALREAADEHGCDRPSDDDTTFVVLRRRITPSIALSSIRAN
jgi:serine phosphatase RsbU (regulator of sigma subunit)